MLSNFFVLGSVSDSEVSMMRFPLKLVLLLGGVFLSFSPRTFSNAYADGGQGWFVPKVAHSPTSADQVVSHHAVPARHISLPSQDVDNQDVDRAPPVLPLPPVPAVPDIPKGAPPPAAVIGVISIDGVMRQSFAAMQVERVLGARRDLLARDVQKEQAVWRLEQQKLQAQAQSLTQRQIQERERGLQARVLKAQRIFRNRGRIIQEAAQVSLGQIERELVAVLQKVAAAHGMNLVLHSEQVALHVDGQDITNEVALRLNKVLPMVFIPAPDVDPEVLAKSGKMPTTADANAQLPRTGPPPVVKPESVGQKSTARK